ncbi:hypothetical protein EAI_10058 [Harpegnathos saltator]|uniref:C2H2-type domain-containing protein n=1 Tax=Harpegnathos saltator TaxID=610380 RepID=E2BJC0_HARSA|nr:hypothetical protein EAI_10058 [Harpegnathos saltator]
MYMGDQVLGYTCTMCSKFYKMWSNYLKHKCEPPQFKCPLCPFAAFKAFILHAHQAEQHFKVTSPNTPSEGFGRTPRLERTDRKTYRSRMALNRHVREECGRNLYTCPFCHNIMPMKFNLLNHLKKEHGCVTKI